MNEEDRRRETGGRHKRMGVGKTVHQQVEVITRGGQEEGETEVEERTTKY